MSRYIDADKLQKDGWKLRREKRGLLTSTYETMELDCVPAADVVPMDYHERCLSVEIQKRMNMVEVVRCKDCKHGHLRDNTKRNSSIYCDFGIGVHKENYCSYGERAGE